MSKPIPVHRQEIIASGDSREAYKQEAASRLGSVSKAYRKMGFFPRTHSSLMKAVDNKWASHENPLILFYALQCYLQLFTHSKKLITEVTAALKQFQQDESLDDKLTLDSIVAKLGQVDSLPDTDSEEGQSYQNKRHSAQIREEVVEHITTAIVWCAQQEKQVLMPIPKDQDNVLAMGVLRGLFHYDKNTKPLNTLAMSYSHRRSNDTVFATIFNMMVRLFRKHRGLARALQNDTKINYAGLNSDLLLHALRIYLQHFTHSRQMLDDVNIVMKAKYSNGVPSTLERIRIELAMESVDGVEVELLKHVHWCAKQDGRKLKLKRDDANSELLTSVKEQLQPAKVDDTLSAEQDQGSGLYHFRQGN